MRILPNGAWDTNNSDKHVFDESLANAICELLKKENIGTVVDLGCGDGSYTELLNKQGLATKGYDGNPHTKELTSGYGRTLDLSVPVNIRGCYKADGSVLKNTESDELEFILDDADAALCLEVGEHVPRDREQALIFNICHLARELVILSWAVPRQPGEGHINCRPNTYIIGEMNKRGWIYNTEKSEELRASVSNAYWFKKTLMVFEYKENEDN